MQELPRTHLGCGGRCPLRGCITPGLPVLSDQSWPRVVAAFITHLLNLLLLPSAILELSCWCRGRALPRPLRPLLLLLLCAASALCRRRQALSVAEPPATMLEVVVGIRIQQFYGFLST